MSAIWTSVRIANRRERSKQTFSRASACRKAAARILKPSRRLQILPSEEGMRLQGTGIEGKYGRWKNGKLTCRGIIVEPGPVAKTVKLDSRGYSHRAIKISEWDAPPVFAHPFPQHHTLNLFSHRSNLSRNAKYPILEFSEYSGQFSNLIIRISFPSISTH